MKKENQKHKLPQVSTEPGLCFSLKKQKKKNPLFSSSIFTLKEIIEKMPRPGPRPYVCERRAWHSDRHQPMRGSLIREIFRVVNEIHSSATKKNKEWQEKLPVVVLKAEEIMYSKANSEQEYMDFKTIWDRTNNAINTIIRRDESTETGELLQPCIEAALNLGCTPRTLRSQRNCNPRCYLNTGAQEDENPTRGNLTTNSHCFASFPGFMKPSTINVTRLGSESQKLREDGNCTTNKLPFASENCPLPSNDQCLPVEKYPLTNTYSVYPLYYGNHLNFEEVQHGFGIFPKSISNTVEPTKIGAIPSPFSSDVNCSNKLNQTDIRNTSNNLHELACDLSLRLGPLSIPCLTAGNSRPQEIEDTGSTSLEWKKFSDLTPSIDKKLYSFPRSNRGVWSVQVEPMNVDATMRKRKTVYGHQLIKSYIPFLGATEISSSNEWSVEVEPMNVDATMRKRKTVYGPPADQQFCLPPKIPFSPLSGRMKSARS